MAPRRRAADVRVTGTPLDAAASRRLTTIRPPPISRLTSAG